MNSPLPPSYPDAINSAVSLSAEEKDLLGRNDKMHHILKRLFDAYQDLGASGNVGFWHLEYYDVGKQALHALSMKAALAEHPLALAELKAQNQVLYDALDALVKDCRMTLNESGDIGLSRFEEHEIGRIALLTLESEDLARTTAVHYLPRSPSRL